MDPRYAVGKEDTLDVVHPGPGSPSSVDGKAEGRDPVRPAFIDRPIPGLTPTPTPTPTPSAHFTRSALA